MPRPDAQTVADTLLDGTLRQRLTDARAAGETFDAIAWMLRDLDVIVSRETVRKWCRDLDIPEPAEAASA